MVLAPTVAVWFGTGKIDLKANGDATFAGKVTAKSTESTDIGTTVVTLDYLTGGGGGTSGGFVTLDTQQDGLSSTRKITAAKTFSANVTIDTGVAKYVKNFADYGGDNSEIVNVGYLENAKATASDWVEEGDDISPRNLDDNVSVGGTRVARTKTISHTILYATGAAMFAKDAAQISVDGSAKFADIELQHLPKLPV